MNKYRRHIKLSLIILLASVFFISCGIPSYRTLNGIYISKSQTSDALNITFSGSDTDVQYIKDGPGLLLMYVVTDSPTVTFNDTLISKFKSTYGNSDSIGIIPVTPDTNGLVFTVDDISLYSFKLNNAKVSAWAYHKDLNTSGNSVTSNITISKGDNYLTFTDLSDSVSNVYTLNSNSENGFTSGQYVHVYAAFSCQSTNNNDFSNVYWSDLKEIGYLYFE